MAYAEEEFGFDQENTAAKWISDPARDDFGLGAKKHVTPNVTLVVYLLSPVAAVNQKGDLWGWLIRHHPAGDDSGHFANTFGVCMSSSRASEHEHTRTRYGVRRDDAPLLTAAAAIAEVESAVVRVKAAVIASFAAEEERKRASRQKLAAAMDELRAAMAAANGDWAE